MQQSGTREAAGAYFDAGWPPFPLPARQKEPPPQGVTGRGGVDLTDADIAACAWVGNIGLRIPVNVIGIDVDAYRGGIETLKELKERLGDLPPTVISHNSRGDSSGIRLFYAPVGRYVTALDGGIDIIQRWHRYIVVWPSVHPDGRAYEWFDQRTQAACELIPKVDELPELPWSWQTFLYRGSVDDTDTSAAAVSDVQARAFVDQFPEGEDQSYCERVIAAQFRDQVQDGKSRHDSMTHSLIWAMEEVRAGVLSAQPTVDALAQCWRMALLGEPRRQLIESSGRTTEFQAMLRYAIGKANDKSDRELDRIHDNAVGVRMAITSQQPAPVVEIGNYQVESDDDAATFDPVDLAPYLTGTVQPITPDIATMTDERSLLHRGLLNGVHGDSGAGKSFLVAFVIREQLRLNNAVMVIDLEGTPAPTIERLRQIGVLDAQIARLLVLVRPDAPFFKAYVERLIDHVRERNVTHVFIETLGEAFALDGVNENNDSEVTPWLRRVCRHIIAETGAGITLIDHGTKAAEKPLEPSGSKRKRAAITGTAWLVESVRAFSRDDGGLAVLTCAKDRHGWYRRGEQVARLVMDQPDPVSSTTELRLEPNVHLLPQADPIIGAVMVELNAARPASLSQRELIARVRNACQSAGTRGWDDKKIARAADQAVAKGLAMESAGRRGARQYASTAPLPANDG